MSPENTARSTEAGRYAVDLRVHLQILRPEDTFTPLVLTGRLVELDTHGLTVLSRGVTEDDYQTMRDNPSQRFIRIMLTWPHTSEPGRLFGSIDAFDRTTVDDRPSFRFNVRFGDMPSADFESLENFVRHLAATGAPRA